MKKAIAIVSAIIIFILAVTSWYVIAITIAGGTPRELVIEGETLKRTPIARTRLVCNKPSLYLYHKDEAEVSVTLPKSENLTYSNPEYNDGWEVYVQAHSSMINLDTTQQLNALYYEANPSIDFEVQDDGFVVKTEDVETFLEEKLSILGLTSREVEEFIIYWLPQLKENPYNYIRFATADEIEQNMPLVIEPTPDVTIRIFMTFKGLDEPIEVEEQELLEPPEREVFTAVEWGGTKL